jgi:hypothetical protein
VLVGEGAKGSIKGYAWRQLPVVATLEVIKVRATAPLSSSIGRKYEVGRFVGCWGSLIRGPQALSIRLTEIDCDASGICLSATLRFVAFCFRYVLGVVNLEHSQGRHTDKERR